MFLKLKELWAILMTVPEQKALDETEVENNIWNYYLRNISTW